MPKSGKSSNVASWPRSLTLTFPIEFEHDDPLPLEPPGVTFLLWHFAFFRLRAQREKCVGKFYHYRRVTQAVCIIPSVYIIRPPIRLLHALTLGNTPNSWKPDEREIRGIFISSVLWFDTFVATIIRLRS